MKAFVASHFQIQYTKTDDSLLDCCFADLSIATSTSSAPLQTRGAEDHYRLWDLEQSFKVYLELQAKR